jgi:deoxyribodipyrimidine photo-lyase
VTRAIVWFRNDLRLADNPVLHAAVEQADEILPVFILDERIGGAARWWLHHSLTALSADLAQLGSKLLLRRGDPRQIIPELAAEIGAASVHAGRSFEPAARAADKDVHDVLKNAGVALRRHLSAMLFVPEEMRTKTGGYYGVYSPFARACFAAGVPDEILPKPSKLAGVTKVMGDKLADWKLLPKRPDWAGGFRETWTPGEAGARQRLDAFLAGPVLKYDQARNLPAVAGTSMLSPHVHFGEISPRTVWHAAAAAGTAKGVQVFLKELLWREFSISLLWQHKTLAEEPLRPAFKKFPWRPDQGKLRAWQQGKTGYPIVDAGMRELWRIGWMHNRVRMIAASFLVKHLLIPWQEGAAWFMDTLAEADLAANSASWQWVAGCGADAAPYFRIFNPVLQGKTFDPEGAYVRKYVPALAALPGQFIHTPWEADQDTLAEAGVKLGETYPRPIIDLAEGRQLALAAYEQVKA